MGMVTESLRCRKCGSEDLVRNGSNSAGNKKTKCKTCGFGGVITSVRKSEEEKEQAMKCVNERSSMRGVGRVFGVSGQTISN